MFALNCTITSVLASKVTVKSCYMFYWSDPSVSSGNKKKRNSLKLLLLLFFKNVLKKKPKKKNKQKKQNITNPNLGHFCNRLNPSLNKKTLAIVKPISQRILWMPKKYIDSQAAQPETGNLSL